MNADRVGPKTGLSHRHSGKRIGGGELPEVLFFSTSSSSSLERKLFVLTWGMWRGILDPSSKTRWVYSVPSATSRYHVMHTIWPPSHILMCNDNNVVVLPKKVCMRISLSTEIPAAHLSSRPRRMFYSSWLLQAQQMETWRSWDAGSTQANSWSATGEHMTSALGLQPPSGKEQVESFPRKGV